MEDGRIPNNFKYNTIVRYLISERERHGTLPARD